MDQPETSNDPAPAEALRRCLEDPVSRRTDGFPQGDDDAILRLSAPPCYTACPNPYLVEFVRRHRTPNGAGPTDPFAGDLLSSTRHPVYQFHPYHTKVPPEIIRRLIEHYTKPGDLVLDAFCGSGMTGVAAREAGRHAVLVDLSPVATFIAAVNCSGHDRCEAVAVLDQLLAESETAWGRLYRTPEADRELVANYYVWSDLFTCPGCGQGFPFFPHGVVHHGNKVETRAAFPCPTCRMKLNVRRVQRVLRSGEKQRALVWVNAGLGKQRVNRPPNDRDLALANAVDALIPDCWYPRAGIDPAGYSARLAQLGDKGITDVSRFLSRRNLIVFADLWARAGKVPAAGLRNLCRAALTSIFTVISERQGYFGGGGGMSGNLYMPIVRMEKNIFATLRRRLQKLDAAERAKEGASGQVVVSTQSASSLASIPDASIDYVFTDPPFGANIIYSEMNLVLEAWLGVFTNQELEAVIDGTRGRSLEHYAARMRACFGEHFRVLKAGRWLTVAFHNTSAEVWNLMQRVLGESGFVVAGVSVCNKGNTTILGDIRPASAKHDLMLSALKPASAEPATFSLKPGTVAAVWAFVEQRLTCLPMDALTERGRHLLFDRMVAWHVEQRLMVPLSAADFNAGLRERFVERDGVFYLPGNEPVEARSGV